MNEFSDIKLNPPSSIIIDSQNYELHDEYFISTLRVDPITATVEIELLHRHNNSVLRIKMSECERLYFGAGNIDDIDLNIDTITAIHKDYGDNFDYYMDNITDVRDDWDLMIIFVGGAGIKFGGGRLSGLALRPPA